MGKSYLLSYCQCHLLMLVQNCYPGARVDSPVPIYELAIPEVYKDWYWTTNYPNWEELQNYFDHMDKTLNLSKDCAFETVVSAAEFDTKEAKWTVSRANRFVPHNDAC